jgi:hypothetical protein
MLNGWILGETNVWPNGQHNSMRRCYSTSNANHNTPVIGDYNIAQIVYRFHDDEFVTVKVQFMDNPQRMFIIYYYFLSFNGYRMPLCVCVCFERKRIATKNRSNFMMITCCSRWENV